MRLLQAVQCHYDQNGNADVYISSTHELESIFESWGMRNVADNPKKFEQALIQSRSPLCLSIWHTSELLPAATCNLQWNDRGFDCAKELLMTEESLSFDCIPEAAEMSKLACELIKKDEFVITDRTRSQIHQHYVELENLQVEKLLDFSIRP